jgi:hypothetical protein
MFCCTSIFGVDGFRALAVAAGEGADQRDVHAADEADLARLGGHGGGDAGQVGAFLFLEQDRVHVLAGGVTVDQDEVHGRELGRDLLHRLGLREADGRDQVELLAREAAQHLLGLGIAAGLGFEYIDAGFFLEALSALGSRLVERLVELAAGVVDDAQLGRGSEGAAGDGQRRDRHTELLEFHVIGSWNPILYPAQTRCNGRKWHGSAALAPADCVKPCEIMR